MDWFQIGEGVWQDCRVEEMIERKKEEVLKNAN